MAKNIIIFSDGTGQSGGRLFDEPRSNIYKLYRATRNGPDSSVNPAEQRAFYDPGIGTLPKGAGLLGSVRAFIYNIVAQALGMGLTGNIIDCYAALVRTWRPGDRIFLFGFSRGAYTVRCLGGVIAQCGIPTADDGQPLKRDLNTSIRIAKEAVKRVYQHTPSRSRKAATERQKQLLDQREELAQRFRAKYGSGDPSGPNVFPHFIGVFDTVASLSNRIAIAFFVVIGAAVVAGLAAAGSWLLSLAGVSIDWATCVGVVVGAVAVLSLTMILWHRARWEIGLKNRKWWQILHFLGWRMRFYDKTLNINVRYARHALAIDETREAFDRVPWGTPGQWPERSKEQPEWFEQIWFAGNHSDIGGSYPEDESRLSDVALKWMLDAAVSAGLNYDPSVLRLYPDPTGPQHDETRKGVFRYARAIQREFRREVRSEARLHESVLQRFEAAEVLQYDLYRPYRPEQLSHHKVAGKFFPSNVQVDPLNRRPASFL